MKHTKEFLVTLRVKLEEQRAQMISDIYCMTDISEMLGNGNDALKEKAEAFGEKVIELENFMDEIDFLLDIMQESKMIKLYERNRKESELEKLARIN